MNQDTDLIQLECRSHLLDPNGPTFLRQKKNTAGPWDYAYQRLTSTTKDACCMWG